MKRVFHLLTESEPFSEYHGGAISRWTANILRFDETSVVLAPAADESWSFDSSRVRIVDGLSVYKRFTHASGRLLPWSIRIMLLRHMLNKTLRDLQAGETVWIHNRPEFAVALGPLIRRRGARLFLHLHNSHLVEWKESVARAANADCYIFVSHFLEKEALEKFPNLPQTRVLHNGADCRVFFPRFQEKISGAVPVVLFASRLVREKGLHVFLEAMEILQHQRIEIQGVVVGGAAFGDSVSTAYVRQMQQRSPANVRFEPYCSGVKLAAKFREADIFCLPSCWHDPFPLAPLEAMASGVPVVATNSGGIPEAMCDGGGILVERESASELARALRYLATDERARREIGEEGYESFKKNFTWEAVRRNYEVILQNKVTFPISAVAMSSAEKTCV